PRTAGVPSRPSPVRFLGTSPANAVNPGARSDVVTDRDPRRVIPPARRGSSQQRHPVCRGPAVTGTFRFFGKAARQPPRGGRAGAVDEPERPGAAAALPVSDRPWYLRPRSGRRPAARTPRRSGSVKEARRCGRCPKSDRTTAVTSASPRGPPPEASPRRQPAPRSAHDRNTDMELGNGLDMHKLLDSARLLSEKLAETQEMLSRTGAQGTAGGGAVRASVDGKGVLVKLTISPVVADPGNVRNLADQIVAAVQDAQRTLLDRHESRLLPVLDSLRSELGGTSS